MMSSEEETEFGLYADKLLKKTKRTRQRVDAGEPRNSYSSIPNFSSRPSFLNSGNNLYGAIFTQQQHFGLFGPGFAPAKMLNELLTGRQKIIADGSTTADGEDAMVAKFDPMAMRCADGLSSPPSSEQLAHHMLRDILQGRKHELMVAGQENLINNNNNNSNHNNNNSHNNNNNNNINNSNHNNHGGGDDDDDDDDDDEEDSKAAAEVVVVERGEVETQECLVDGDRQQSSELMEEALNGMETDSLPSPKVEPRSPAKPEDAKKARVENIVSGMRSSPAPLQVNGCKKRKLYQPQQHDTSAVDRYIIDDDDEETEPLRQKQVEKNALKSQLRTMQEQLIEMQQKYAQLCTRMEQNSDDSPDVEEIPSDSEHSKRSPPVSPARSSQTPPTQHQKQPPQHQQNQHQHHHQQLQHPLPTLSQQVSKLKISSQTPHFHNGLLHEHQHLNNAAAAMYLGVSHKFLLEQEARMAKEASVSVAGAACVSAESQQSNSSQTATSKPDNFADRLNMIKNNVNPSGSDLEGLADALKTEITASLSNLIDTIVTRFIHQKKVKQNEIISVENQIKKESSTSISTSTNCGNLQQVLDRKSPKTRILERPQAPLPQQNNNNNQMVNGNANNNNNHNNNNINTSSFHPMIPPSHCINNNINNSQVAKTSEQLHLRAPMFQQPKPPGINHMPLYGMNHPFCVTKQSENSEQNEALSLVVTPKKKRHKVTDTRITPRTVSRILGGQDGMGMSPASLEPTPCSSPRPPPYPQPPPPMLPVSLPTSVAIPNPGLHESQVFSPYSPFFHGPSHGHHMAMQASSSPPRMHKMERESPPIHHPPTLLHPALLAAAQHGASPDYGHLRAPSGGLNMDNGDRNSDCNSGGDISYDGMQPTSSTLTPMHLRKAKLMFFWVRYPSSAVLKMYFPDIKFNKNNTAQLVKWFSNFREFYYIQMEKYARQAVSEGVKNSEDLHVGGDSELYRVLNLHYNRNNHIEVWGFQVPSTFRFVVEQTLREFFKAIQEGRDSEQSWKKSIYKIISRMDDPVPEYFKSPNFLEQLE